MLTEDYDRGDWLIQLVRPYENAWQANIYSKRGLPLPSSDLPRISCTTKEEALAQADRRIEELRAGSN